MGKGTRFFLPLLAVTLWGSPAPAQNCATPGQDGVGNNLTGVVNTYYPGTAGTVAPGSTSIPVGAPGVGPAIAAGNLLLVIQMQDADIDSDDDDTYGDGVAGGSGSGSTALNSTGLYEYVMATGPVSGGNVPIAAPGLINTYRNEAATAATGQRRYQVIRVPQYSSVTLGAALTASGWDGTRGGVLAIDVRDTLDLNGQTISVAGTGFRGGLGEHLNGASVVLLNTAFRTPVSAVTQCNGNKGEGIAGTPEAMEGATNPETFDYANGSRARGAPGNAGGGGNAGEPNSNGATAGGGGGGNGGTGGQGGNTGSNGTSNINLPLGGHGGALFPWTAGRVAMGGGGGSGAKNSGGPISGGGAGGGILMIRAGFVTATGTISADGLDGIDGGNNAGGGGGAGGTVILSTLSGDWSGATITARGGDGGTGGTGTTEIGPGGGGGGGVVMLSGAAASVDTSAGANGLTDSPPVAYGATSGGGGSPAPGSGGNPFIPPSSIPGTDSGAECVTSGSSITANNDSYSMSPGETLNVAAPGILANDTPPAGLTAVTPQLSGPDNGTLALNSDGSFTYTPNAGFVGNDVFTYRATDGTDQSNVASVTIQVGGGRFRAGYCGGTGLELLLPLAALWALRRPLRRRRA